MKFVINKPISFDALCTLTTRFTDAYKILPIFWNTGLPCNPCLTPVAVNASISVGRKKSGTNAQNTSFTVGFTGGASAAGTWIVLTSSANTGFLTVTGGTNAWTQLGANSDEKVYVHLAAASEPATYTITYNGAAPKDSAGISMVEILGAGITNPDVYNTANSTATCPTVVSTAAGSLAIVTFAATSTGLPTAPSGFTMEESQAGTGSPDPYTAIASKPLPAPGSLSPGNWSLSGNIVSTIVFKP